MSSNHAARGLALCALAILGASVPGNLPLEAQEPARIEGEGRRFYRDDPIWVDPDMRDIPPVAVFDLSKSYEFLNETFGGSSKSEGPALNVNTLGEIPDSSWFTNRLGRHDMTIDAIVRGPDRGDGPAPGTWVVTGRPEAGITPKFTIRDARGDTYLIKLDPKRFPELPSSVELISTKIFHAIGYHVPEDFIVHFDVSRLEVAPGARMMTPSGGKRLVTRADLDLWLSQTSRAPDGSIRALASLYVPGKVVGQFRYNGTRPDDPNDIFPHERRRELRGLRVFAAWLNHDDARSINSLDAYVEDGGRRYIRHYLQDFGSNLGSGSTSAQQPRGGYEYLIEKGAISKGVFSLGLWSRDWTKAKYPQHPSLGNVEADYFEPRKWKTEYPQPAFDQMDAADAFWAASIAARFTDPMIDAIVAAGQLSDPAAASFLKDVIIRRRDKVVAYWITGTNPIDGFEVRQIEGAHVLAFDNAAVRVKVAAPGSTYVARWSRYDNERGSASAIGDELNLTAPTVRVPDGAFGPRDADGHRYAQVAIGTIDPAFPHWASPVVVTLRCRDGAVDIVGIERPAGQSQR
jgi:hypothetical protein